jgi:hypothetical protein
MNNEAVLKHWDEMEWELDVPQVTKNMMAPL